MAAMVFIIKYLSKYLSYIQCYNLISIKTAKHLAKTKAALLAVHISLEESRYVSFTMASSKQSSFSIHSRHSPSSALFKEITINVSLVLGILVYTLNDPIHTTIDSLTLTFDQYL